MSGKFITFEGSDGSGKSTMSKMVHKWLTNIYGEDRVIHTRHPGSTEIGASLRHLVKHSEFEIDMKTERLIMATDNCAFIEQILKPGLKENKIILADRSNFISDYPYGLSAGVKYEDIRNIHNILSEAPKADLAIIYSCPWHISKSRMFGDIVDGKQVKCRIESRGDLYFQNVIKWYEMMTTGEACNGINIRETILNYTNSIETVDASLSLTEVEVKTRELINKYL